MKNLLFSLMLLFPVSVVTAQEKPAQSSQTEEISRLINQLGADKYEEREAASAALAKIGKPAIKALMKARESKDVEVASRANELIEKITGQRVQPEKKPGETPSRPTPQPGLPGPGIDPDALKDMLEKMESFGGLSPELKKTLEGFQKFFEETQSGTPDLSKMGELFKQFFDKELPRLPDTGGPRTRPAQPELRRIPELDRELTKTNIEKQLGFTLRPVSEALKAHIFISPRVGNTAAKSLEQGLVIEKIDPKGHAFAQGFRKHDILIFVGSVPAPKIPLPGPQVDWNNWRGGATTLPATTPQQLETLEKTKLFIEVVRKGTPCKVLEVNPLPKKTSKPEDDKDF